MTVLDVNKKMFLITSSKDSKVSYRVEIEIGTCSCDIGKNGAPCSHQAALVLRYNIASVYFVPTLHPSLRQDIAILALGNKASKSIEFYSSLHEGKQWICATEECGPG